MGVERIEKVARVKSVDYDISRPFDRKEGYEDRQDRQRAFKSMLQKAMKDTSSVSEEVQISAPYTVDCTRATQSLFYASGNPLGALRKLYGKG